MKKKFILLFLSLVISKSFGQNSIEVSKTGNAGSFANYLLNMDKSTDPTIDRDVIAKKITAFNESGTDVQVIADYYTTQGSLKLKLEIKREPSEYIKMEPADD